MEVRMMPSDTLKALIQQFVHAWNSGSLDGAYALLDPDIVDHETPPGTPPGLEGVKLRHAMILAAFPDLRIHIEDLVVDGDRVAGRFVLYGTHTGPFMGVPPSGRRIAVGNLDINRVVGGTVVERWGQFDALGLIQQIGTMPSAEQAEPVAVRPGSARPAAKGSQAWTQENKAVVRRQFEAFNRGVLDDMDPLCTPDVQIHHPSTGQPMDLATGKRFAALFRTAFPDSRNVIEEQLAEGDLVVTRGTYRGTHRGDFMGIPSTGRQVAMPWISMDRLVDGRIGERWVEQDTLGLLQQLGALPAPAEPAAATV
jgi:predicted ester cyclase